MSEAEFEVVTDKLQGVTNYIYYHVMGEPTSHPQLTEFIKIANSKGFKSAVTTNGSLLSSIGDSLIESGVYKVNVSVHSFESNAGEDYESYLNECFDFADKASSSGVLVILRLWNKGGDERHNDDIESRLLERFPYEWKRSGRGARIRNKLHLEYGDRFVWPDMNETDMGDRVYCYGLNDHFAILCDGTVVPCCLDHEGDIPLGNVFENEIDVILGSKRAEAIQKGFQSRKASEELCRKCGYARRFKI
jgi:radical SAM protein with 4Fe4S-binding SPASM domain